jgi:hypothetical protein
MEGQTLHLKYLKKLITSKENESEFNLGSHQPYEGHCC